MLYLHEIIDIIGAGQESYLETVGERARHSEREGMSRLMGTWKVIGSTHRWPRVVNLWEMDGWEQWAGTLERQFLPGRVDAALAPWWAKATQWRSGGFDRILEPAPGSPTRDQLRADGLRAWVCVHTLARTQPGQREAYLATVRESFASLLRDRECTLMGAYSVPMRSDEVLVLWAAPDFRHLCRMMDGWAGDPELRGWRERSERMCAESETMWLVPSPDCFFHPGPAAG
ncbi:hypothetical protein KF840_01510 [bacterium]|nr:hypothetical protein [bacterium]